MSRRRQPWTVVLLFREERLMPLPQHVLLNYVCPEAGNLVSELVHAGLEVHATLNTVPITQFGVSPVDGSVHFRLPPAMFTSIEKSAVYRTSLRIAIPVAPSLWMDYALEMHVEVRRDWQREVGLHLVEGPHHPPWTLWPASSPQARTFIVCPCGSVCAHGQVCQGVAASKGSTVVMGLSTGDLYLYAFECFVHYFLGLRSKQVRVSSHSVAPGRHHVHPCKALPSDCPTTSRLRRGGAGVGRGVRVGEIERQESRFVAHPQAWLGARCLASSLFAMVQGGVAAVFLCLGRWRRQ
jgi:hypothetical protein